MPEHLAEHLAEHQPSTWPSTSRAPGICVVIHGSGPSPLRNDLGSRAHGSSPLAYGPSDQTQARSHGPHKFRPIVPHEPVKERTLKLHKCVGVIANVVRSCGRHVAAGPTAFNCTDDPQTGTVERRNIASSKVKAARLRTSTTLPAGPPPNPQVQCC